MRKVAVPEVGMSTLFGAYDVNLRQLEALLNVRIRTQGHELLVEGLPANTAKVARLIEQLGAGKKRIAPKSANQRRYLDAIDQFDIVFGIGPAGTGKTYLAMAQAVSYLLTKKVSRIVLVRPAVEAGEKLGFLPGDLQEKVNPYLRPLYDALYEMVDTEKADRLLERGTIEVAPLAFMRGRTLNDAVVILDEAQNTTVEQMKMFLTRLGFGSKAIVTGDVTQIDLPLGRMSGLVQAMEVVGKVDGISFIHFDDRDVVRHKLVQAIVKAYDAYGSGPSAR